MRLRYLLVPLIAFAIGFLSTLSLFAQNGLKIEGTYQIEKGKRQGWLIVNLEIPEGHHVYALTQKGTPPPTTIKLEESDSFKVLKKFSSNKKPKVIEHDPIFDQRIEEYVGKVALMAPIRIADGADLENVKFDLKISGQLCSDTGCQLFKNKEVEIEFAGYYEKDPNDKEEKQGSQHKH